MSTWSWILTLRSSNLYLQNPISSLPVQTQGWICKLIFLTKTDCYIQLRSTEDTHFFCQNEILGNIKRFSYLKYEVWLYIRNSLLFVCINNTCWALNVAYLKMWYIMKNIIEQNDIFVIFEFICILYLEFGC